jgi:hypothetical protein
MTRTPRRFLSQTAAACGFAAVLLAGCSAGPANAPVDPEKARRTLRTALDSWKYGDAATALQGASPPIYVIDPEWQSGVRLTEYQILGDGEPKDAHLFCKVRLTVRGADGKEARQEVTFIVSTAPNLTVSRKIF